MRCAKCERDPDIDPTIESHAGGSSGRMHVVNMGMVRDRIDRRRTRDGTETCDARNDGGV